MAVRTIEEGTALLSLGLLDFDDIPALALLFIDEGSDVPEMAALAGSLSTDHPADRREELHRALRMVGYPLPSRVEAAQRLRWIYAKRGASRSLPPREAARLILNVYDVVRQDLPDSKTYVGDSFDIEKLVGLYYSYDDIPPDDVEAALDLGRDLVVELTRLSRESR